MNRRLVLSALLLVACIGSTATEQAVRTIQEIRFTGNAKLGTAALRKAIGIKVGDVYTREAVDGAMTHIIAAYRAAGSDLALRVDISQPDASHAIVNFLIDENGTGGNKGTTPRSGGRSGGAPRPPPPATRQ